MTQNNNDKRDSCVETEQQLRKHPLEEHVVRGEAATMRESLDHHLKHSSRLSNTLDDGDGMVSMKISLVVVSMNYDD